jgi:hypothetical protein
MPTGWRPEDVKKEFPLKERTNIKYETPISQALTLWSFFQLFITSIFMLHFLYIYSKNSLFMNYLYASILLIHIFSFTSALDQKVYSIFTEIFKVMLGFYIISYNNYTWFDIDSTPLNLIISYSLVSLILTIFFYLNSKTKNKYATLA